MNLTTNYQNTKNCYRSIPYDQIKEVNNYLDIERDKNTEKNYYKIKFQDNSMEPRISKNDDIIIKKQSTAKNGNTAIIIINQQKIICRKIKKIKEGTILIANNKEYEEEFFPNSNKLKIIGIVIESRKYFN